MNKYKWLAGFACILLTLTGCKQKVSRFRIVDEQGKGLSNVTATFIPATSLPTWTVTNDSEGYFILKNSISFDRMLAIEFNKPGYKSVTLSKRTHEKGGWHVVNDLVVIPMQVEVGTAK